MPFCTLQVLQSFHTLYIALHRLLLVFNSICVKPLADFLIQGRPARIVN